ncbi:MAG: TldD/PmbA family protein, partial [Thaumarchaeota archaeon]|nr:TldD/PmbA family protein [Nitrososphaerota archaeon]
MFLEYGEKAIKTAQRHGATYCDVRVENTSKQGISIENGQIEHSATLFEGGIGVRVVYDGAWGFFSTSDESKLDEGIIGAIKAARSNSLRKKNKTKLAEISVHEKTIQYPVKIKVDLDELTKISLDCDRIIRENNKISKSIVHGLISGTNKYFANSEGAKITQDYTDVTMDLIATAHQSGLTQSINTTEGGRGGLEKITKDSNIYDISKEISQKAVQLLDAKPPKEEKATLVMNPDFVALLTHEILGHPSEADRVLGKEMAWAGGAWWAGMLGQKVGSDSLNVIDDPTISGSLGWYQYDDEGTESQRKTLVKNGILTSHMHSRETADTYGVEPNASMRATSYSFMPLIRMACTCIDKGDWDPQEMIKGVKHGYMISNMKIPSIDMKRHN